MAFATDGRWVPSLVPKGYTLFNDYHRFCLCHGPRRSGKSLSVDQKVCRHLWEVGKARVGIICRTLRNGKVGVWRDFTTTMIPEWKAAGFRFDYTVQPRMEADSKMSYFRVRNMHGGESELQLHSLEHDDEVETRFKDTRFSMIYMVEADKFKSRHVFNILTDQLRIVEVPFGEHQFIADCNPPDEGEQHWLHEVFFQGKGIKPEFFEKHYLNLFFPLDENQFISDEEKEELHEKYRYDRMRYQRFVEGKWVRDVGRTLFNDVFVEGVHVCGDTSLDDPQVIAPPPGCNEINVGADLGDLNHACVFGCKRLLPNGTYAFDLIDEAVSIGKKIPFYDYVDILLEKMNFWDQFLDREYGVKNVSWRFWSDSSSLRFKSAIGMNEALLIQKLSNGRIMLNGVGKGAGSVAQRIVLAKQMLHDERLFVSASCTNVIQMFRNIEPARSVGVEETDPEKIRSAARNAYSLKLEDKLKHAFDALTYMLAYESPETLIKPTGQPRIRVVSMA